MGSDVTTNQTDTNVKATPEEERLNQLTLERVEATQEGQITAQRQGLNLVNQLLTGRELPGYLGKLPGGLSEEAISRNVQGALGDVASQSNVFGILDSGVSQEVGVETAADIRSRAEEFNIGNLLNLLNIAVGGQAQVQAPLLQQSSMLGTQLAGLRSTSSTQTQTAMNPFLKSFQSSLGKSFGSLSFGNDALSFGGPSTVIGS